MKVKKKRWESVCNVWILDKRFPTKIAIGYWVFPAVNEEETIRHLLRTLLTEDIKKQIERAINSEDWQDDFCTVEMSLTLRTMREWNNGQEQK